MNQEVGGSILGKCNFQKKKKKGSQGDNAWGVVSRSRRVGRVVGTGKQGEGVRGGVHKEDEREGEGKSPF